MSPAPLRQNNRSILEQKQLQKNTPIAAPAGETGIYDGLQEAPHRPQHWHTDEGCIIKALHTVRDCQAYHKTRMPNYNPNLASKPCIFSPQPGFPPPNTKY